jgi:hypothetical protein
MTTTGVPASRNARTTWEPMYPAPPVTSQLMVLLGRERSS